MGKLSWLLGLANRIDYVNHDRRFVAVRVGYQSNKEEHIIGLAYYRPRLVSHFEDNKDNRPIPKKTHSLGR